jgi:tRNA A-37 threonylcarbamoyl transferase component Bud32
MVTCPVCATQYPDGAAVCPRDGARLGDGLEPQADGVQAAIKKVTEATTPMMMASGGGGTPVAMPEVSSGPVARAGETFDPLVGAALAGRYLIVRRIGEGGMGAVYEAKHMVIGKRVAVKVLLEKFHSNIDLVARLLQEARLASSIGHENIVDVTDFGTTDDGRSFVVMEFLDGEPLAQLVMREAPLPVERSLRIARQVASALGAAHAKGIYHRDVKPENVYLVRRGDADFVKVVDFGISKAVKQGGDDPAESYRLTHTGLLLGTPLYMSPEQARGEDDLDHRVDIWALGVMLYECLTGEVPFHANNYLGIISQVLTKDAPPPSRLRPELGIPEAVEAVVMRAMEKDRQRRYQAMGELEHDLERLLAGDQNVGVSASAVRAAVVDERALAAEGGPRRWHLLIAGATVMVVGIVLALRHPVDGRGRAGESAGLNASAAAAASSDHPPGAEPGGTTARGSSPTGAAALSVPAASGAAGAKALSATVKGAPARRKHKFGAGAGAEEKVVPAGKGDPSESVKRGVLSPRAGEAYPD